MFETHFANNHRFLGRWTLRHMLVFDWAVYALDHADLDLIVMRQLLVSKATPKRRPFWGWGGIKASDLVYVNIKPA